MSRSDSIAAHLFQHLNLANQCRLVDSSPQGTQVVMQTDTFNLTRHTIQLEATLAVNTHRADTRLDGLAVEHLMMSLIYLHLHLI